MPPPIAEPVCDIRAQLAAVLDPGHHKQACFMVPDNAVHLRLDQMPLGAYAASRAEGTLVTVDRRLATAFDVADPNSFDEEMATILGYPEAKAAVMTHCGNRFWLARAVQARDARGHVIQEAFASPAGFLKACDSVRAHVPSGGRLVFMDPAAAIARRLALRFVEF